jgi:Mg-chelatase subunit ChlD
MLAGLAWFWWNARRARSSASVRTAVTHGTVALLLVLAISGLQFRGGASRLSVMFALDMSDSVMATSGNPLARLGPLTAGMRSDDRAGLVVFGANAAVERRPDAQLAVTELTSKIKTEGTNIEAALGLARSALPGDGGRRVVLVSDGQQTAGNALREAALAAGEGVRIDVVTASESPGAPPVLLTRLAAPTFASAGAPFVVTATVEGEPGARAEVLLYSDAGAPLRRQLTIPANGVASALFVQRHRQSGVYSYRATATELGNSIDSRSTTGEGVSAGAVVSVGGEPRLLYVAGAGTGGTLSTRLGRTGFRVDSATALPRSSPALLAYDGVVLDDVAADALDSSQGALLEQYVEQYGGGLLVLGSPRSLEGTSAADSAIGRLLPVDLRPRAGRRAPAVAMVVVFDKSGSMNDRVEGTPKIEFARQAVRRAIESLAPTDAVGVIAFDAGAVPVAPLIRGQNAAAVGESLRSINPGGPTALAPALELARDWLQQQAAAGFPIRHILLVSDGRAPDAARAKAAVSGRGFELSAVATGSDADRAVLTGLAGETGGRAFFLRDARELPAIVEREVTRVAGGRVVIENFVVRSTSHPVLAGIDPAFMPTLGGYVVSAAKPDAETPLSSHLGDPILATWRVGLGRVGVYTADLNSTWSAPLRAWTGFGPLFTQTVRWLSRQVQHDSLFATFTERDEGVRVVLEEETPEGQAPDLLDVNGFVRQPGGETANIKLTAVAPGRYEADLPLESLGPYIVALEAHRSNGALSGRIVRGFYWSARREHRRTGADETTLRAVAAATGGRRLDEVKSPFSEPRETSYREARPWLSALAGLMFLAELLTPASFRNVLKGWRPRRAPGMASGDAA